MYVNKILIKQKNTFFFKIFKKVFYLSFYQIFDKFSYIILLKFTNQTKNIFLRDHIIFKN